jgi:hypothetical protein
MASDPETAAPDPGAPVPKDAIDPELVSLRPRTQIGLVTALSIVAFCVYLTFRLWPDLTFSRHDAPRAVTVADVVAGTVAEDSHVRITAALERTAAVRVQKTRGVPGLRVVPAAGGGDRLWIVVGGDGLRRPREDAELVGRLRRLSDMPFSDSFVRHVRAHPMPRHVTGAELRRARTAAGDGAALTAVTGDTFTVAADDVVELVLQDPDMVTIAVSFNERQPDEPSWAAALMRAGFHLRSAEPVKADSQAAWFEAEGRGVLAHADRMLKDATLYGALIDPVTLRRRAAWRDLAITADGVTVDGATMRWTDVDVAAVHAARPLPDDPYLLLVGEEPEHYWYILPLYVLLVIFAAVFAWGLIRTARRELLAPKAPTPA